jgi:hypothetical protein
MLEGMQNNGWVVTVPITRDVIAGLDPAIHHLKKCSDEDGWIRGSSPRMTAGQNGRIADHDAA